MEKSIRIAMMIVRVNKPKSTFWLSQLTAPHKPCSGIRLEPLSLFYSLTYHCSS